MSDHGHKATDHGGDHHESAHPPAHDEHAAPSHDAHGGSDSHGSNYDGVMKLYEQLKAKGPEYKAKADVAMQDISSHYTADHPAPPAEIEKKLQEILSHGHGDLEHKASSGSENHSSPHSIRQQNAQACGYLGAFAAAMYFLV